MTPEEFFTAALPSAQSVHWAMPEMFVSVVLAQWADEQGYQWPPMYNNPGNVGDPVSAGQRGYATVAAGVDAYAATLRLDYYVAVRAARTALLQCYALGESAWAASHYEAGGGPPGHDLVAIVAAYDLTKYDATVPVVSTAPIPPLKPTVEDTDMPYIAADADANYLVDGNTKLHIADPAELKILLTRFAALPEPIPLTLAAMPDVTRAT